MVAVTFVAHCDLDLKDFGANWLRFTDTMVTARLELAMATVDSATFSFATCKTSNRVPRQNNPRAMERELNRLADEADARGDKRITNSNDRIVYCDKRLIRQITCDFLNRMRGE